MKIISDMSYLVQLLQRFHKLCTARRVLSKTNSYGIVQSPYGPCLGTIEWAVKVIIGPNVSYLSESVGISSPVDNTMLLKESRTLWDTSRCVRERCILPYYRA